MHADAANASRLEQNPQDGRDQLFPKKVALTWGTASVTLVTATLVPRGPSEGMMVAPAPLMLLAFAPAMDIADAAKPTSADAPTVAATVLIRILGPYPTWGCC